MTPEPNKKLSSAFSKFDIVADKTSKSLSAIGNHFVDYVRLNRPDNYSSVRNKIKDFNEFAEKHTFLQRFVISKKNTIGLADGCSRYLGGTTALAALSMTRKAKSWLAIGAVGYLASAYIKPEGIVGSKIGTVLGSVGLLNALPYLVVATTVVLGFTSWAAYEVAEMRKAARFDQRSEAHMKKMVDAMLQDGFGETKRLNKLVDAYEKEFKPNFTSFQAQSIKDDLAQLKSERLIVGAMSPDQVEAINKIAKTLTKQYFVPQHLSVNAGLQMLVEMKGDNKAVDEKLKSRQIEEEWLDRYSMDPRAAVKIKKKSASHPGHASPDL